MRVRHVSYLIPAALVVAGCNTERPEAASRDLTLLPSSESATPAVASARELDLPKPDVGLDNPSAARLPTPMPARVHARPAAPSSHSDKLAPVPDPAADLAPTPPAPGPQVAATGGAGMGLEPGQTVTVLPASSSGTAPLPASDISTEEGIKARPWIIIGDDRCIPGRGEVMPRGHRGWHWVSY